MRMRGGGRDPDTGTGVATVRDGFGQSGYTAGNRVGVSRACRWFFREAALPNGWDTVEQMAATLSGLANDLEAPAISLVPAIGNVLHAIAATAGCLLARMSGSGATCFGLFANAAAAQVAAAELARPGWWSWGGPLAG